jgi:preprotein translocase SecE subunit
MTEGFGDLMIEQLKQFFSEAKAEFKKISWPSTEDIKGSTAVVCLTIFFLMVLLGVYDLIIQKLVMLILK